MNAARLIATALLASAAATISGTAVSQPHAEPEIDLKATLPVTEPGAMGEWLQRLAGKFRFTGMVQKGDCVNAGDASAAPPENCEAIKGHSDCIRIGDGPGVQCILNVTWLDIYTTDFTSGTMTPKFISTFDPAMQLFGLDPGNAAINHMIVDNKGLPEGGLGFIKGNVATFKMPCVNTGVGKEASKCYDIIRIEAGPDARRLYWWLIKDMDGEPPLTWGVFALLRLSEEETEMEFAGKQRK